MNNRIPEVPPKIEPIVGDVAKRPLWSVMIPSYNCIQYIKETLVSVLIQAPGPDIMQIEVVDDCSSDGDVEAVVKEIGNGRITFFRQEINVGSLRNFETCINRARGHYIHLLHGDDRIGRGFYKEIEKLFVAFPQAGAAFSNFSYIDHVGRKLDIAIPPLLDHQGIIKDLVFLLAERQLIQPPAIAVKRDVYEKLGGFYAVHYGEDWEMWTRIASSYQIAYTPKYLAEYRVSHGIGISHNYFLTGQNVVDIEKVIGIIQNYLPPDHRLKYKKLANAYYAMYSVRIANGLLLSNEDAAFRQLYAAWKLHKNLKVLFWMIRFYLMYILRYKQIEKRLLTTRYYVRMKKYFSISKSR